MDRSRGVAGICMKMLPSSSCGMPLVTAAWCGFLRDGIEGRWGCFHSRNEIRSPSPRGLIPDRYSARGVHHLTRFPVRNSPKILFPPRARLSGAIARHCPPPLEGAGGGRGSGREGGGVYEYRSTIDTGDRGGGSRFRLPPPRRAASPTGVISHRYGAMEEAGSYRSHLTLPEDPVSFPCTVSGLSPLTARPPMKGAGGGRASGREAGVGRRKPFNQERAVVIPGRNGEFISQNR